MTDRGLNNVLQLEGPVLFSLNGNNEFVLTAAAEV